MKEPSSAIWKANKLVGGIIVLLILLTILVLAGVFGYHKLQPVINKDAYNKKCSIAYDGCGKYGETAECSVLGAYDSVYKRKVYTTRGTVDYTRYKDGGQLHWFCSEKEAQTAGYKDAYQ